MATIKVLISKPGQPEVTKDVELDQKTLSAEYLKDLLAINAEPTDIEPSDGDIVFNYEDGTTVRLVDFIGQMFQAGSEIQAVSVGDFVFNLADLISALTIQSSATNSLNPFRIKSQGIIEEPTRDREESALGGGDTSGNTRDADFENFLATITENLDTVPPGPPTINQPIAGDNFINAAEDNTLILTGTAEPLSQVNLILQDNLGNTVNAVANTDLNGQWQVGNIDVSGLNNGPVTISATATDLAGNTSGPTTITAILDNIAPNAPILDTPVETDNIVNDAEDNDVLLTGTAEPNSTVDLTFTDQNNNTITTQALTDNLGNWTLLGNEADISGLTNGPINISGTATDLAGNVSPTFNFLVELDNIAPPPPVIDTPIEGDDIVNAAEDDDVLVSGTAEPNSTIDVTFTDQSNNTVTTQVTANGAGVWTLLGNEANISGLDNGPITVSVTATDTAGNTSPPATQNILLDNIIPPSPNIDLPIEIDNIVNGNEHNDVLVSGTGEPNGTINVSFIDQNNNIVTAQVNIDNLGNWTLLGNEADISGLVNGPINIAVTTTDAAGNVSPPSIVGVILDNMPPAAPTIDTPIEGDNIVNAAEDNDVLVSGTAEPNSTIDVTFTDQNNNTVTAQVMTNGAGVWTLLGNEADISGLEDGPITVSATATDAAGNTSPVATANIVLDNDVPLAPTIDTPIEGDNIVNAAEDDDVLVSGTAEPNSTIDVTFTDQNNNTVTAQVTTNGAGVWTLLGNEADISGLDDGPITVSATATDAAGNTSPAATANITLDNDVPLAPTIDTPIEGDNIVNAAEDNDVLVSGTAEPNSTVDVTFTDQNNNTVTAQVTTNGAGVWTLLGNEADISGLDDGPITVSATATDTAGNTSPAATANIILDNDIPAAPTIDTPIEGDNIVNAAEDNDVLVSGTAEPNSTVDVTFTDQNNNTVTAQVTTNGAGVWTLLGNEADISGLDDGPITVSATATDAAGNTSPAATANITLDNDVPLAPTIDTPIEGDNIVNAAEDDDVLVSGTAEPNSTIGVTFLDQNNNFVTAQVTTNGAGVWTLLGNEADISGLDDGPIAISATATDGAGNISPPANANVTLDNDVPLAPTIDTPIEGDNIVNAAEDDDVLVSGTAEPNSTIDVTFTDQNNNTVTAQVTTNGAGVWTLLGNEADISGLDDGPIAISATSTDGAGNISPPANANITLDNDVPLAPTIDTPIEGDNIVNAAEDNDVLVSGTAEPNSTVDVTFTDQNNNTVTAQVTTNGAGVWTLLGNEADISGLDDGPITVSATATDAAGNTSPAATANITLDNGIPAAPTIDTPIEGDNIVNAAEDDDVLVSGTAEPNSTVDVTFLDQNNNFVTAQVTTNGAGVWTLLGNEADISGLDDGPIVISATATDGAGNISPPANANVTLDNGIPAAPTIDTPIEGDNIVNAAEDDDVLVSGTAEPNSAVDVTFTDQNNNTVTAQVTTNGAGVWTLLGNEADISGLDDGPITVSATATDAAGNTSPAATTNITLDNGIPAAPTIDTPIEGDNIVNAAEDDDVLVSGTAEPNSTVDVTFLDQNNNFVTAQATTNGAGVWTLLGNEADISGLDDGPIAISATATDAAGNTSPAATANIVLDNDVPLAPTIDTPIEGDNIVNAAEDNDVLVSGTAEPNSTVEVTFTDQNNNTVTAQVTTNGAGVWTLLGNEADISGLDDGPITVSATATDAAGNTSPAATANITLDNGIPAAPTIDTPIEGDNIVNAVEDDDVLVSGTAEPNSTVDVTFTDQNNNTVTAQVTTNGAGVWTLLGNEADISGLDDGPITVSATATDAAGNTSPAATANITLDNGIPAAPTIDTPIEGDNIVNAAEDDDVLVSGTAEPNSTVDVTFLDQNNNFVTAQATTNGAGVWTLLGNEADISGLDDGPIAISATATDGAGNISPPANANVTLDNDVPLAPTIDTPIEGDNIVNAAEDDDVLVSGTAEPNSTVDVTFLDQNNNFVTAQATTNGAGVWTLLGNEADISGLDDGPITVSATATDAAGNTSPAATANIVLDNDIPLAPTIDSPIEGDNIVNAAEDDDVLVSGTAEPNSTVDVTFTDQNNNMVTAQVTTNGAGVWTLLGNEADISGLDDGPITVSATATDAAGNTSPAATANIVLDNDVPLAPTIDTPIEGDNIVNAAEDDDVLVSGTAEPNSTVDVTFLDQNNNFVTAQATTNGAGVWTLLGNEADISGLDDGPITVSATATDAAGNTSPAATANIVLDNDVPLAPTIDSPIEGDNIVNAAEDDDVLVSGTAEPNSTIDVTFLDQNNNFVTAQVTTNGAGVWTLLGNEADISGLDDGPITVSATATDAAGNTSPAATANITLDNGIPAAPTIDTPIEGDNIVNAAEDDDVLVSGTAEPNSTIDVTFTDQNNNTVTAQVTTNGAGVWTLLGNEADISGLDDGPITVSATATDAAGNTSPAATANIVLDNDIPLAPTIDSPIEGDNIVNAAEDDDVLVSGTAEPNSTVDVTFLDQNNNFVTAQATTNGAGVWTLLGNEADISGLDDGPIAISATATDGAGNISPPANANVTLDNGIPAAPTIDTPIEGDNIVNAAEDDDVLVSGTAEPNSTIDVTFTDQNNNTVTAQVTTNGAGVWTLLGNEADISGLDDGPITVSATATDAAGNTSPAATANIVLDNDVPLAPTIDSPIEGDNIVNAAEDDDVLVSGTAEPNSTIDVTFLDQNNNFVTAQVTTNGAGVWTLLGNEADISGLDDGPITVSATATDAAGNTSPAATANITLDNGIPAAPTIDTPIEGDNIVNAAEDDDVLVSGTAEPNSTVDVTFTDQNNNTVTAQATTNGAGVWTLLGNEADISGLDDGPITVSATATDAAGNTSPAATANIALDNDIPTAPTIDTPIEGDNIVNAAEDDDVLVSGTAEPNSTIDVTFLDQNNNFVTAQVTTNGAGVWTLLGNEADISGLDDGPITVSATATDAAGNASPAATANIILDNGIPAAPTIDTPIEGDNIVNAAEDNDVLVSGTAEPNSTIDVTFLDQNNNFVTAQVTTNGAGVWTLLGNEADISGLDDGPIAISATSTDAAGNTSPAATANITLDNGIPAAPTIDTPIEGDNIVNAAEDDDVLVSGTAEPNSTVDVTFLDQNNNFVTAQATTNGAGVWTLLGNEADISGLDDGPITVSATATDAAGNTSPAATANIVLDNDVPLAPTIDTPIEGDNIVNAAEDDDVLVSGMAEPNSTIDVTFTDQNNNTVSAQVTTNGAGVWTLLGNEADISGLDDGPITVSATATDAAGNTSPAATANITLDNGIPAAPTIDTPIEGDNIVNAAEDDDVLVSGTAEPNSTVDVTFTDQNNNTVTAQVTTNGAGVWTLLGNEADISGLDDGPIAISATATDGAGNISPTANANVTLDNDVPLAPTIDTPIEGDNIVNAAEDDDVLVSGTAEPNSTVDVTFLDQNNNFVTAQATTNGAGVWTLLGNEADISGLDDGPITVSATATDAAGNTSPAATANIVLDNDVPLAPTIDSPIEGDNIVNATEDDDVLVSGTAEPNSTVDVTFTDQNNNTVTAQATTNGAGVWTLLGNEADISGLDDGPITVSATATDAAGNTSPTATANITLDNGIPVAPTIDTPIEGDNIVNAAEDDDVLVSGTAEPNSTVDVTFLDQNNNFVTAQATTNGAGVWTLLGNEADISGLDDGPITVSATATDAAGNTSPAATANIVLDNDVPLAPTIDTPIEGDNVVNESEDDDVLVSGTAEPNSTVDVTFLDQNNNFVTAQATTNGAGVWTLLGNEADISGLDDGPITVSATATDAAGNTSPAATANITLDNGIPAAPTIDTPIEGDNIVNAAEDDDVLVSGTAEPNSTVDVTFLDQNNNFVTAQATTNGAGVWTLLGNEADISGLDGGPITVSATATDAAGNTSPAATANIVLDNDVPLAPTIDTPIEGDNIVNAAEDDDVLVSGTAEPNSTVDVTFTDQNNNTITAQVTTNGAGVWTLLGNEADISGLDDGPITVSATATDAAGNTSPTATANITLDNGIPVAPTIDTPIEGDNIVNATEDDDVLVSGTAEPNSTVDVTFTDQNNNTVTAQVTTNGAGVWTLLGNEADISGLDDGPITVSATATDAAGNTSPAATANIVLDNDVPLAPTIDTPIEGDNIVNAAEDDDVLVSGTAEPNSTIDVTFTDQNNNTVTAQVTTNGAGVWTLLGNEADISGLDDGPITVSATATDAAGNTSPTATANITLDNGIPVAPTIDTPIEGDNIVNATEDDDVLVSGTAEPNSTVDVTFTDQNNNTVTAQVTTNGAGVWTLLGNEADISGLDDGPITVSATATDAAGNTSPAATANIVLDNDVPLAPTIDTPIEGDNIVNAAEDNDVLVSGTAEPNSTVDVTFLDQNNNFVTAQVTTNGAGVWTLLGNEADISGLDDGPIVISATSTDAAGNISPPANANVTLDNDVPLAPTIDTPIEGDNIVNAAEDNDVLVSGTAEPNSTVDVTFLDQNNNFVTAQVTTNGAGVWTLLGNEADISGLDDGPITVSATATDAAGNTSPAATTNITLDNGIPAAPTIDAPIEGDNIVNAAEDDDVLVSGTAEPNSTVDVTFTDQNNNTVTAQVTTNGAGVWTLLGNEADISGLDDGPITVSATATDAAGNTSPAATANIVLDNDVPLAPTIDTPIEGDNIVNAAEDDDVLVSGTAEPNSTVDVTFTDQNNNTVTAQVTTNGAGVWTLLGNEADISGLDDGPITVSATATDAAGNTSPAATANITLDNGIPAAPTIDTPIEGDNIVNAAEDDDVLVSGTAEPNSTIDVTFTDQNNNTVTAQVTTNGAGVWTLLGNEADISGLDDGPITVSATATDAAGNTSPAATANITLDNGIPAAPTIDTPIEGDNIVNAAEDDDVLVSGTAEPNSIVNVTFLDQNNNFVTAQVTTNGAGVWTLLGNEADISGLDDGPITVSATATDAAGNTSPAATTNITLDNDIPLPPTIDTPIEGDNIVDADEDQDVLVSGTAEPNSVVDVTFTDQNNNTVTAQALTNALGVWTLLGNEADITNLDNGTIAVSATATDAAGNTSTAASVNILLDQLIVNNDTANTTEDNSVNIDVLDNDVFNGSPTITGVGTASNGMVIIEPNNTITYVPNDDYNGTDSFTYTVMSNGLTETGTVNVTVVADADPAVLVSPPQALSINNPPMSFESGFTSWSTSNSVAISTDFMGVTPTQGSNMAELTTGPDTQASIESALGLAPGTLDSFSADATDGAYIQTAIQVNAGDTIDIDWNFYNGENAGFIAQGYNDIVVLVVDGVATLLARASDIGGVGFLGWQTQTFNVATDGIIEIGFVIMNVRDTAVDSTLLVDNVRINGQLQYVTPIELNIDAEIISNNPTETLTVQISNVPLTATLSAGNNLGGGVWELTPAQLAGLTITPAIGFTGTINLTVTAISTEPSNNDTANTVDTITVIVGEIDDSVFGTTGNDNITGDANSNIIMGRAGNDTISGGSDGDDVISGGDGVDNITTAAGNDDVSGDAGNDVINTGADADKISGGAGDDTLTGGAGSDSFAWALADQGTIATPAVDTITDFTAGAGGDTLELGDMLQGATIDTLSQYLDFQFNAGNTEISVSPNGDGNVTQTIVLQGVDITAGNTLTEAQIISNLLDNQNLTITS